MTNYIKSELYRIFRNKWSYLFVAICSILLISSNIVLAAVKHFEATFPYANTQFSLGNFYTSFSLVYILCITVASMVFGNEHSNHTMKNSISYGISRGHIYFGKLIVEMTYAMVAFSAIAGLHIASAYLLLDNSGPDELGLLLRSCFACLPMFLFALAATNCFVFNIESTGGGVTAMVGILIVLPLISNLLGMKFIIFQKFGKLLPWNLINNMQFDIKAHTLTLIWDGTTGYINYWLVGILEMILISIIGFMVFRKKEIK